MKDVCCYRYSSNTFCLKVWLLFFSLSFHDFFIFSLVHRGFRKIPTTQVAPGIDAFYHNDFKRDYPELMINMKDSKKKNKTGGKAKAMMKKTLDEKQVVTPPMTPVQTVVSPESSLKAQQSRILAAKYQLLAQQQHRQTFLSPSSVHQDSILGSIRADHTARLMLLNNNNKTSHVSTTSPLITRSSLGLSAAPLPSPNPMAHMFPNHGGRATPQHQTGISQLLRNTSAGGTASRFGGGVTTTLPLPIPTRRNHATRMQLLMNQLNERM